ncbi:MAG: acetyl-CoA carboxylase, biotin carboxyl carrier protein [Alphaproteobacteria bacterium]|nr:acetyl-CoA carboxylase, biotin carboxyl carrier protein [Alphaproteobacteria bacterium]
MTAKKPTTPAAEAKDGPDDVLVRELARLLQEHDLSEIEIERQDYRVRVARLMTPAGGAVFHHSPSEAAPPPAPTKSIDPANHPGGVHSPMVGTVYVAPQPGAPAFVKLGDSVSEGQTLLIVEAMKTMNPILSPRAGRIARILVSDGQPVEFGETLMIIE